MLFRNREELDEYLARRAREIEDRLYSEQIEKPWLDFIKIQTMIDKEVARETRRILEVAELERPWEKSKRVKLVDLKKGNMRNMYLNDEEKP